MAEKYLPIKIVQKREKDASLTEAGGGDPPAWMEKVDIEERSEMMTETLKEVEGVFDSRSDRLSFVPATIQLSLDNKAIAKTYRSEVRKIVDVNYKNNIIGLKGDDTILVKVDNREDLKEINRNVTNFKKSKEGLASIVNTSLFKPEINVEEKELLKIKLLNYQDNDINNAVHLAFLETCEAVGVDVHSSSYTPEMKVYQLPFEEESFAMLQEFEAIASIEDMVSFDMAVYDEIANQEESLVLKEPNGEQSYPTIGVLDSGIARNGHLAPWILQEGYSAYIESDIDYEHGTSVASVILYGDEIEKKEYTSLQGCYIYDACIMPKKKIIKRLTEVQLIEQIREAIASKPEINIWNMSVGWGIEAKPSKISDFGAALDNIADEFNIIICTSIGNCENFKGAVPPGRIQVSSDSIRALSVGSIAHEKSKFDFSEIDEPSPFSRKGPGPFNIVKPELVHYGGNAGRNERNEYVYSGVKTINQNGQLTTKSGTSFSTPRVTSILAAIESELEEDFDPLLYKALLIHSAKYPSNKLDQTDKLNKLGYGIPQNAKDILYNSENEITLIIRDNIEKGNFIEILDLPFPKEMVDGNYYYGEVIITLVSSPDLDINQDEEYCQSNIDVFFGTYNEKVEKEGRTIRNPIRRDDGTKNLLSPALYSSRSIKENKAFMSERILKSYYQKYQPVKKWAVNLSEMSEANKTRFLEYPKLWYLKIECLFRDHIENRKEEPNTDFCLILTIRDPKEKHQVYNSVSQELDQNNFVQQDIKVRNQIKLNV